MFQFEVTYGPYAKYELYGLLIAWVNYFAIHKCALHDSP